MQSSQASMKDIKSMSYWHITIKKETQFAQTQTNPVRQRHKLVTPLPISGNIGCGQLHRKQKVCH